MELGKVYWLHNRVFIAGQDGRKWNTGLVIEANGLHTAKVPVDAKLVEATYHGGPYPARKMRGHLRKIKAQTDAAQALKNKLLN